MSSSETRNGGRSSPLRSAEAPCSQRQRQGQGGLRDSNGLSSLQDRVARLHLEGSVLGVFNQLSNVTLEGIAFNQDGSCFTASTSRGFRVYTTSPLSEFLRLEEAVPLSSSKGSASTQDLRLARPCLISKNPSNLASLRPDCEAAVSGVAGWPFGGVRTAAMLFKTNIFALVFKSDTKKIKFWDDKRKRFIGELRSRLPVSNVVLARDIIAMVTEFAVSPQASVRMLE